MLLILQRTIRRVLTLCLGLLALWYLGHAFALFRINHHDAPANARPSLAAAAINAQAHPLDLVVVRITTHVAPQQARLRLTWTQHARQRHVLPLTVRLDGGPQTIVAPVGAHPGWQGGVRNLRLVAPYWEAPPFHVARMQVVAHPPLALDGWLLRAAAHAIPAAPPVLPPYAQVQRVIITLLVAGLALAAPWSHWRRRLALVGLALAGALSLGTVLTFINLLSAVGSTYGGVSDQTAARQAPTYTARSSAIAQLLAVADQLPAGPVLLLDVSPVSDLLHRARYRFYPRRVDVRSPQQAPAAIPQLLTTHYTAAIQATPTDQPPAPGWVRVAAPAGPLAVWRAPVATWPAAGAPLLAGLVLVGVVGWACASALGWPGRLAIGAAWPLGAALLAWWMWLLDSAGFPWSPWSIGAPLLLGAGLASAVAWQRTWARRVLLAPAPRRLDWPLLGWALLAALTGGALVQAVLMPFTDRDTWTMWGLKGQAFFLDGAIAPVLTLYRDSDAHHASYPPAQPLAHTWLYLMMGGINERLVKAIFPLWYLAGALVTWWACRRWLAHPAALGWTLLLATTPLVLDHATLGAADLPLAVALLLGGVALVCWIESGERRWILGGAVALGAAAWIKLDGSYLGAGLLSAAVLVHASACGPDRAQRRRVLRAGGLAFGLFAALVAPWLGSTRLLELNDVPDLATFAHDRWALLQEGARVIGTEVFFSYHNSSMGLLGGGYGIFWLICLGALGMGWRRLRHDAVLWFLLLAVAGGFLFYLAIYTVRPSYSVERYRLHLAPLALLAAARASRGALHPHARAGMPAAEAVGHPRSPTQPSSPQPPRRRRKGRRV